MQPGGYMGKMLYVDLATGNVREDYLAPSLAINFIGDYGISARLAYDLIEPGMDPLSPDNCILIGAGPLAGTTAPGSARCHCFTKWPATNTVGPAGGSMGFGSRLKYSGYDHLIITGRAARAVYLRISDEHVAILDAADLWGKDIFEATDRVWGKHGTMNGVLCIGQAGENLVKNSLALIDKTATIGRYGLGAVMGSKNLKLIIVGGKKGVPVSDLARFTELTEEMRIEAMNWSIRQEFIRLGHVEYDFDAMVGVTGITDYYAAAQKVAPMRERFGPEVYLDRVKKTRLACPSCPVACRDVDEVKKGPHEGELTFMHSFSATYGFQLNLKSIDDLTSYLDAGQRYGLDRMTITSAAQFLIDLHKRGIITEDELEGIEMGNEESLTQLLEKVAFRQEGIGSILADGYEGIVNRFGRDVIEKYGNYIKRGEPYLDARLSKLGTFQLDQVVNPLGPNQGKGGQLNPGKFDPSASRESFVAYCKERLAMTQEEINRALDTPFKMNMARLLRHTQDYYVALSSLGMCMRVHSAQFYGMERLAQLYCAVTGVRIDARGLKTAADRAWNMVKAVNVREGFSRKDDRFPLKWLEPLKRGDEEIHLMDFFATKTLTAEDLENMLDDYYQERGWELERGIPTKGKLMELGLGNVAEDLERGGVILK